MLLMGVALGWLAGFSTLDAFAFPWRSGAVATVLAACVVGYDMGLKSTAIGPALMGACRALNVLLGMSLAPVDVHVVVGPVALAGFNLPQLALAAGLGVYVAGITWYARTEASESGEKQLLAGTGVMALGIALFAAFPLIGPISEANNRLDLSWWCLLLAVPAFTVLRRCVVTAMNPSPRAVQIAVKQALISLIVLDAAATLMVRGPLYALAVVVLLVPTLVLGFWVYST
jgi:4-hydroxybenzoate polyprenyltransferase